ncbi:hypothetical protein HYU92_06440 [Candidatus Curtissbacteria bacterium]|nr:hypothetical protein [Candidatus Curtissbacteria bacterium]
MINSKYLFWLLPILIFISQAIYTYASAVQIRLEEVIETFRSVWWFQNGLVWNGSYSFLGWYTTLAAVYNTFGMGIYTPKMVKLAIELVSYFCLAAVLRRYFSQNAWLPLLVIGLSPTFMYFNSLSLSMGLEVSYFFICLWLLVNLDFKKRIGSVISQILIWGLAMFAWLSYFGFIFYLPILGAIFLYKLWQKYKLISTAWLKYLLILLVSFLTPLILLYLYTQNKQLLILDPLSGKGLFRSFAKVELAPDVWFSNLRIIWRDLFVAPTSYYFEAFEVEFSDFYPVLTLAAVFVGCLLMIKTGKFRKLVILLTATLIFYFLLISLVGPETLGGIRRGTVLLVIFYGLLAIVWDWTIRQKRLRWKYLLILGCSLILFHHAAVYPVNLGKIRQESVFREKWWFNSSQPERILAGYLRRAQESDVVLTCVEAGRESFCPGISLIYPAIAGFCHWNNLSCRGIFFYESKSGQDVPVDIGLWGTGSHTEP